MRRARRPPAPSNDAGAVGRAWARVLALVANANGDGPGPPEAAAPAAAGVTPPSG